MSDKTLHIVMYPWFAMGHLTSFLHISNKLDERGHKISFFLPNKTQAKLEPFNLHKDRISFIPITVPHVDGLPSGAETTADVPFLLQPLLMTAMDLTAPFIESFLRELKPHFVFYDFTHWLPALACRLGIKSIRHCIISPATVGYLLSSERIKLNENALTEADFNSPLPSFPPSSIKLLPHEIRQLSFVTLREFGRDISFKQRQIISYSDPDAITFKACREMEGPYCDYVERQFKKPVILAGPVVPEPPTVALEEKWAKWLDSFKAKTVIFCAFGSECILKKDQFQELVLGFELTGMPFLTALKPPIGAETIESALPEGFEERAMVNECQMVLLPNVGDQVINARLMGGDIKVGVEVEKGEEDGLFTREGVCKAVKAVMDEDSNVGVRTNHAKWREFLLSNGLENSYIDSYVQKLHSLLK
uniref:Glycosyltransferase subfamily 4-like N-terminal domain-containing protein n=1 Tax=Fagus sylvatica TaxID=28930 RepID=A0A2N9E9B8_FAGSY